MNYRHLLETMTPAVYDSLRRAVELGKWPDGRCLTAEQRETCLQAVIAYDNLNRPEDQRVGHIPAKKHEHCGGEGDVAQADAPRPLKWREPSR